MKSATTYSASPRFLSLKGGGEKRGYSTTKVGKNNMCDIIMYLDKNLSAEKHL